MESLNREQQYIRAQKRVDEIKKFYKYNEEYECFSCGKIQFEYVKINVKILGSVQLICISIVCFICFTYTCNMKKN